MVPLQVDATWYGHVHSYSRTCPVYQRNCMGFASDRTANAPVHLLIGHAGESLACFSVSCSLDERFPGEAGRISGQLQAAPLPYRLQLDRFSQRVAGPGVNV